MKKFRYDEDGKEFWFNINIKEIKECIENGFIAKNLDKKDSNEFVMIDKELRYGKDDIIFNKGDKLITFTLYHRNKKKTEELYNLIINELKKKLKFNGSKDF